MKIFIKIMYDGTNYHGWQIQPDQKTVQGEVARAIQSLTGENVNLVGSGRTDAGVHALGQGAHFDLSKNFDIKKIPEGLNFYLNDDIKIIFAQQKKQGFDARKSAKRKTYIYKMYVSDFDNPLLKNRELRIYDVDVSLMKAAALKFVGRHDFKCFMSSGSDVKTTVREVYSCALTAKGKSLCLKITANGFLYNMVRKIAGAVIMVGCGKKSLSDIDAALNYPFNAFIETAPAHALYLYDVKY